MGQPQGPSGPQRVRGRLPRPRQHRRVRPQRAAAHRRPPRAGRRHRVDGDVQPEHARAGAASWPSTTDSYEDFVLKFVEHFFWIAAAIDPIGDHPDEMWDEEDGFFYDVLRLPDGTGTPAQGALARRPAADVRDDRHRAATCSSAIPQLAEQVAGYLAAQPGPARQHRRPARARGGRPPPPVAGQRGQAAAHPRPGCSTRSASSARTASGRSRAGTSTIPYVFDVDGARVPRAVRAGRVDHRDVRRQLELAGPGLVPDQPPHHPRAAAALPVLRRRLHDRVPDRLGQR